MNIMPRIQPVEIQLDEKGNWRHPDLPDFVPTDHDRTFDWMRLQGFTNMDSHSGGRDLTRRAKTWKNATEVYFLLMVKSTAHGVTEVWAYRGGAA